MSEITFVAEDHSYWIGKTRLASVSELVKSFAAPFDKERISKQSAARAGVTQKVILEEWERKGEAGRDKGTMVHAYVEDVLDGKHDPILAALNERLPEMDAFDAAWESFRNNLRATVVRKEFILGDAELGVAGRADILLSVRADGKRMRCLFDWKTGRFQSSNYFQRMLPPFHDADDCELVRYSIQLSMYRLLLEREQPEEEFGDGYIVHLKDTGRYHIYRTIDYRERLGRWLKTRKR